MDELASVKSYLEKLQDTACKWFESREACQTFSEQVWEAPEKGGGSTRVLQGGRCLEKAAVNLSCVAGSRLPVAARAKRAALQHAAFEAVGLSIITHPLNPFAPTSHANVRFFRVKKKGGEELFWFGGGFDLTPFYGFKEDAIFWHREAREACEAFGKELYPQFKKNCDAYFYLKHRKEARGVGGLFFDDYQVGGFQGGFDLIKSVAQAYFKAYLPILDKRKDSVYTEEERQWQLYRRGRYVEFNLLYDRGTLFGLQSGGRVESILASLPPRATWTYRGQVPPSQEEKNLSYFLKARDWLGVGA